MNNFIKINLNSLAQWLACFIVLAVYTYSINHPFFWDTIQLGSLHAHFFYQNGFSNLLLPDDIDSGHIPAFGYYLSLGWKILGRTLLTSHLLMLPFVIGILWQVRRFTSELFPKTFSGFAFLIVLLEPTLLSQITLVSPDICLVFFFLLALNSLWKNKKLLLSLAIVGLFLTSMRGMMVSFILLLIDIIFNVLQQKKSTKEHMYLLISRSVIYLPAFLIFIFFSYHHYQSKGWIGFHQDSPWAGSFDSVGFYGFLKNIGILGWRLVDFGRIGLYFILGFTIAKYGFNPLKDRLVRRTGIAFLAFLLILPLNMLWAQNILAHRYLLPIYISFTLFFLAYLNSRTIANRFGNSAILMGGLFLIFGHFWVYPNHIAQGWDSSLAHLPYFQLRIETIDYLDEQNIELNEVGSFFPFTGNLDHIDLNGDQRSIKRFQGLSEYVVYSNVFNVEDHTLSLLKSKYYELIEFKQSRIFMRVYKLKINND